MRIYIIHYPLCILLTFPSYLDMFQVILLLALSSVECVVDGEYVIRVEHFLQFLLHLYAEGSHGLLDESLPDLADSMMMGDAPTTLKDLIPALCLDLLVNLHHLCQGHVPIREAEVGVNSSTCIIDLGDPACSEDLVGGDASLPGRLNKSLVHRLAEVADSAPGHRRLKGLSHEIVVAAEISDIGDHVGEEVPSDPILLACLHASILGCNGVDMVLLELYLVVGAFEEQSQCGQLVLVKALHIEHVVLLDGVNDLLGLGMLSGLEGHAEHELSVVHETHGGCPDAALADLLHELDAQLEVGEEDGAVDLLGGDLLDLDYGLGDQTEVALLAHDHVVHVGTVRYPWPLTQLGIDSLI